MSSAAENSGSATPSPVSRREAIEQGQIVIGCDVPPHGRDQVHLKLPLHVLGWAYSRAGIERVEVQIDGQRVPARYGLRRNDVAEALSEPAASQSGFTAMLDRHDCAAGPHTLTIVVADRAGETARLSVDVLAEEGGRGDGAHDRSLDNEGERYVPEAYRGTYTEVEHEARYSWAAPLAARREVLDAGCGVGWGTVRLARGARRTVGVDIDEPALANARERAGERAEFVRGDLLALPFPDSTFDLVVCFEAIEHVADPQRALDELRRVLRPTGMLAVSSPNRGVYPAGNPHHMHELTSQELEDSLRGRFANVTMYRQQTHLAAFVSDDRSHSVSDPEVQIACRLYKTSGGQPGEELYAIGLAGDSELPVLEGVAALGAPPATNQLFEQLNALEHRALLAETKYETVRANEQTLLSSLADARRAQAEAEAARAAAERWLAGIEASASWRLTKPLRTAKRLTRGPHPSRD